MFDLKKYAHTSNNIYSFNKGKSKRKELISNLKYLSKRIKRKRLNL